MNTQFIGYEYNITYDDYSMYKDLAQNIDEIKAKCFTLENSDDSYYIEYKEKYKFEDKYLYSEVKTLSIENQNQITNDNIKDCIEDLNKLMEINK